MKKHTTTMLLAAAVLTAGFGFSAFAKGTTIAFDKLPAAVQTAITGEAGELKVCVLVIPLSTEGSDEYPAAIWKSANEVHRVWRESSAAVHRQPPHLL